MWWNIEEGLWRWRNGMKLEVLEKVKREEEEERERERIVFEVFIIVIFVVVLGLLEGLRGGVVVYGGYLV